MKRVVVSGARGLIGWHAHVRLHAQNCAAEFRGQATPYEIIPLGHAEFEDEAQLRAALTGADAVLHFAGVNRATDDEVEEANPNIARALIAACKDVKADPHIVYANSTHARGDTPYGRSKRIASMVLDEGVSRFTDLILPHVFGEGARPFYNNVTATLIHQISAGEDVSVNPDEQVHLLHVGVAAQAAIEAIEKRVNGMVEPPARPTAVPDLFAQLKKFHDLYQSNIYPNVRDSFDLALFNSYRAATYPEGWPRRLKLNTDARGTLFEAVKGGGGGQSFLSSTKPGITRGDHFHFRKVERFLVVKGEAIIRIRKVLSDEVWEYHVSGDAPSPVDMPTLHTHSIENVGDGELLTMFWSHDLFDPAAPDTYADKVLK